MKKRGFALLTPERRREIASLGGKAVAPERRTFSLNREAAKQAGAKGGRAVDPRKRAFSRNPTLAVKAGSKGGNATRLARIAQEEVSLGVD